MALAFFLLAGKLEDARQLTKRMSPNIRILIDRICKCAYEDVMVLIFADSINDDFCHNGVSTLVNAEGFTLSSNEPTIGSVLYNIQKLPIQSTADANILCEQYFSELMKASYVRLAVYSASHNHEDLPLAQLAINIDNNLLSKVF